MLPQVTVRKLKWFGWVREIPRETGRYLTRYSVREQKRGVSGGGWRAYIHRFWSGDLELHDHPWYWSFSLILWGSYTERYADMVDGVLGPIRTRRVRWFNFIPRTRFHQITELHGRVWTLFFAGPLHHKSWGFWVPSRGRVHHDTRKKERGLPTREVETK